MINATETNLTQQMARRREQLGMSFDVLAERSGVSAATLKRMLGQTKSDAERASFRGTLHNVQAVATALGMVLTTKLNFSADELCQQQAETKARELVAIVQGTSALEDQGLDTRVIDRMIKKTMHQLLVGPRRRLWGGGIKRRLKGRETSHE